MTVTKIGRLCLIRWTRMMKMTQWSMQFNKIWNHCLSGTPLTHCSHGCRQWATSAAGEPVLSIDNRDRKGAFVSCFFAQPEPSVLRPTVGESDTDSLENPSIFGESEGDEDHVGSVAGCTAIPQVRVTSAIRLGFERLDFVDLRDTFRIKAHPCGWFCQRPVHVETVSPPPAHAVVEAEQRRIGPQGEASRAFCCICQGEWASLLSQSEEAAKSAAAIRQRRHVLKRTPSSNERREPNRWRSWASCHPPGWHWTEPVVRFAMNRRSEPSGTRADVLLRGDGVLPCELAEQFARASVPDLRMGRMTALQKPSGGVRASLLATPSDDWLPKRQPSSRALQWRKPQHHFGTHCLPDRAENVWRTRYKR